MRHERVIPRSWFRLPWKHSRFVGYAFIDHVEFKILRCNETFARTLEYDSSELSGRSIEELSHDGYARSYLPALERIKAGESEEINRTVKYVTKTNRVVVCKAITTPIYNADGQLAGLLKQMYQIVHAEEVQASQQELQAWKKQVEKQFEMIHGDMRAIMGRDQRISVEGGDVNVGNSSASAKTLSIVVVAIVALIGACSYLAYVSGWGLHNGDAKPPQPPQIEKGMN